MTGQLEVDSIIENPKEALGWNHLHHKDELARSYTNFLVVPTCWEVAEWNMQLVRKKKKDIGSWLPVKKRLHLHFKEYYVFYEGLSV